MIDPSSQSFIPIAMRALVPVFALGLIAPAFAQEAPAPHRLPFASEGNTIELSVANTSGASALEGSYILVGGLRRDPYEAVDGSKRLTAEEHLHARCMSGMSSDRATLVCPLGSDPTGPVLLQALGQNQ